jgi:hypothetical protein
MSPVDGNVPRGWELTMTTGRVSRSVAAGLSALAIGLMASLAVPAAQAAPRPAAHTAQTARAALAAKYKYTLSKMTFTGSLLTIAATDTHVDLYYF